MACPVVARSVLERPRLLVEVRTILPQGLKPFCALTIEPDRPERQAQRVDAVHDLVVGHQLWLAAKPLQRLDARAARAQLAHPGVMRHVIGAVLVGLAFQHRDVMAERLAVVLIGVDDAQLVGEHLKEPDRCAVADTQVPRREDGQGRIVEAFHNAARALGLGDLFAVVGADDRRFEAAQVFLRVLLRRHHALGVFKLLNREQAAVVCAQAHGEPVVRLLCVSVDVPELVAALRRADEHRPALPIAERRPDDLGPYRRPHVRELVHDDAVEEQAPQAIGVVRAVEPDAPAVGQVSAQFALVDRSARDRRHHLLDVDPGHVLRLREVRRDVGEAGVGLLAAQGRINQVRHARHRLAGASMADQGRPALAPHVERHEGLARLVVKLNDRPWHAARRLRSGSPAARRHHRR